MTQSLASIVKVINTLVIVESHNFSMIVQDYDVGNSTRGNVLLRGHEAFISVKMKQNKTFQLALRDDKEILFRYSMGIVWGWFVLCSQHASKPKPKRSVQTQQQETVDTYKRGSNLRN